MGAAPKEAHEPTEPCILVSKTSRSGASPPAPPRVRLYRWRRWRRSNAARELPSVRQLGSCRALAWTSVREASARIFWGRQSSLPLILAPTGLAGLFWPGGEIYALRAASEAGIPFCLSTTLSASMEEVAEAIPDSERWFQLYMLKDKGMLDSMVDRARAAGYRVLCLTVDLNPGPERARPAQCIYAAAAAARQSGLGRCPQAAMALRLSAQSGFVRKFPGPRRRRDQHRPACCDFISTVANWDSIARICERWKGQFILKACCIRTMLDGPSRWMAAAIVSNHGGRQLDQVSGSCAALPGIANAVGDQTEVILDGGVRRGTDILKALALGASACMIGRPVPLGSRSRRADRRGAESAHLPRRA